MRHNKKILSILLTLALMSGEGLCVVSGAVPADGGIADFSWNLLRQIAIQQEDTNIVLSPVSVAAALAMTEAGASGETLAEMERVLCDGISADDYRDGLFEFLNTCERAEDSEFVSAQSVWVNTDEGSLREEFERSCTEQIGAELMTIPFDETTAASINRWVSDHTDGQVAKLLDEIPETAMMYLVDVSVFREEWQEPYGELQVMEDQAFRNASGVERTATMLSGTQPAYIQLEGANGFVKDYQGGKFAFVALLPPDNVALSDYLSSVTGKEILQAYRERKNDKIVYSRLPELDYEFEGILNESLQALGMKRAFMQEAEFDRIILGGSSLYLSRVLQKASIEINRNGTKASAATEATMLETATEGEKHEVLEIILNRPFLFEIVETSTGIPIFLGIVQDIV